MVEEPQGQGGLDGEIRVPPLPAPPAAPAGCPGRDRVRGHPHRHLAASNKGLIVGRPVRNAVVRLIRGMDLRLHPCSVAPAERHEKGGPRRPTRRGSSCNNARHIAASNEGPVVGRPIRNAVLRLIRGMNLRLHPCSVAPAETRRVGQTAPPQSLHATTPVGIAVSIPHGDFFSSLLVPWKLFL